MWLDTCMTWKRHESSLLFRRRELFNLKGPPSVNTDIKSERRLQIAENVRERAEILDSISKPAPQY